MSVLFRTIAPTHGVVADLMHVTAQPATWMHLTHPTSTKDSPINHLCAQNTKCTLSVVFPYNILKKRNRKRTPTRHVVRASQKRAFKNLKNACTQTMVSKSVGVGDSVVSGASTLVMPGRSCR